MCLQYVGYIEVNPAKTDELIKMPFGTDWPGPKNVRITWETRSLHGKGHFWGIYSPLKSKEIVCYGLRSKKDHSFVNNGMQHSQHVLRNDQ